MRVLTALALPILVGACFRPEIGDGQIECAFDRDCPPGFVCRPQDDRCWREYLFEDGSIDTGTLPPDGAATDAPISPVDGAGPDGLLPPIDGATGDASRSDGPPPPPLDAGGSTDGSIGPFCGDTFCNAGETCLSCPMDCPPCPPSDGGTGSECGNFICQPAIGECFTCPIDCAGYPGCAMDLDAGGTPPPPPPGMDGSI